MNLTQKVNRVSLQQKFQDEKREKKLTEIFQSWKNYHQNSKNQEMMMYTAKFFHDKRLFKSIFVALRKHLIKKVVFQIRKKFHDLFRKPDNSSLLMG